MGKLHKDIATFMVQCVEDENQPNEQCIMVIIVIFNRGMNFKVCKKLFFLMCVYMRVGVWAGFNILWCSFPIPINGRWHISLYTDHLNVGKLLMIP